MNSTARFDLGFFDLLFQCKLLCWVGGDRFMLSEKLAFLNRNRHNRRWKPGNECRPDSEVAVVRGDVA